MVQAELPRKEGKNEKQMQVLLDLMKGINITLLFVAALEQNYVYTKYNKEVVSKQHELREI